MNSRHRSIIDFSIDRSRAVVLILLMILIAGTVSYLNIPKEDRPDVQIPIIYVSMTHEGISPEDAERLLVRPMEQELRTIEGVKEVSATAMEGQASVVLEFIAGFDSDEALLDVREKVDIVIPDLPDDTDKPTVNEVNLSLFPVLNIALTGNIPERSLLQIAKKLRDKIEGIASVLSVDIAGEREESVEIILDPLLLESYKLTSQIVDAVKRNNLLVTAGTMDTGDGRYQIKVPGLLENLSDILTLPIKVKKDTVVTVGDIASVRKSFKDSSGSARVNGKSALVLEVSKRTGENIIETIEKVREVVKEEKLGWPKNVTVVFSQDRSDRIRNMITELQNNILFAVILVLVVVIWFVGIKSAGLISLSIPGSFLIGILIISTLGLTLNLVVLFSLILSVGMLVDSAVIVVEYANRKMIDGESYKQAYIISAKRMTWPIVTSTLTTLLVFAPLLYWPGVMGQFMKYLPLTLIATLSGSLLMALIFMPVIGTLAGKTGGIDQKTENNIRAIESRDFHNLTGFTKTYVTILDYILNHGWKFTIVIITLLTAVVCMFSKFGAGVEFFPDVEPDNVSILVRARGNLSVVEKDNIVKEVELRISDLGDEIKVIYARSGSVNGEGRSLPEDVIGIIQLEYSDWKKRRKSVEIINDIKLRTGNISGIIIESREDKPGLGGGRSIEIEVSSHFPDLIAPAIKKIRNEMNALGGFVNVSDSRPIPAIEWKLKVDRGAASVFGADIAIIGNFIKMVTNGMKVTSYRPNDSDDEVDILLRFPPEKRGLQQLDSVRAATNNGVVPLTNFIKRKAKATIGRIERVDGARIMTISADQKEGLLANDKIKEIKNWLTTANIDPRINVKFRGEEEDKKETKQFLIKAFVFAMFCMILVLVIQFNSIYYTIIIMSAVFLSTIGVLLGLLVTAQPFGIVMCGVGVISLAGIVVNNNIIFIDTYKELRKAGIPTKEALIGTGAERLRPILLTAGTTVLGLIPMVLAMNINFITREVYFNAPSTQWWQQLSTAIAGGLTFATILTLFLTPSLLMLGEKFFKH